MIGKEQAQRFLSQNYLLLTILIGTTLVSLSIGPYQNGDTQWEYSAAMGVIKWGIPYVGSLGNIINQPPLGFYLESLFFRAFGESISSATIMMTLFGLGSTLLVYKLGRLLYGKPTALIAAVLFGLTPWELALSRSFLIDVQCLFLSLLCLYVGILAMRRGSLKLSLLSGIFFAAALLTKNFAAFILIPLSLLYILSKQKKLTLTLLQVTSFALPPLLFSWLWYDFILGKGLGFMFQASDFGDLNYSGVAVSPFFAFRFLWVYSLGAFFVLAAVFSLLLIFPFRKKIQDASKVDLVCLATILPIVLIDMVLGVWLNLKVPYTSAVKYDYQALPFLCLIAASLAGKCFTLLKGVGTASQNRKRLLVAIAVVSAILLSLTIAFDVGSAHHLAMHYYIVYQVTPDQTDVGYSFFRYTPTRQFSVLVNYQYLGYAIMLLGLLRACWGELHRFFAALFKPMSLWIKTRNAAAYPREGNA